MADFCVPLSLRLRLWTWHWGWLIVILGLFSCIVVSAFLERGRLLRGIADLWIVSDAIEPADAVVVLGGGLQLRPFVAAELYNHGLVSRILLSQVADEGNPTNGRPGETELTQKLMASLGVPDAAVETFGNANRSTMDEALALAQWAKRHKASAFIIPTEVFSARRVRWTFRQVLSGMPVRIAVPSFEPKEYTRANWWRTWQGVSALKIEIVKYAYYRLRY